MKHSTIKYEFSAPWYKTLSEIAKVLEVPVKQVQKFPMRKEIILYNERTR